MEKSKLIQMLLIISMLIFLLLDLFTDIKPAGVLPILMGLLMLWSACMSFKEYKTTKITAYLWTSVIAAAAFTMAFFAGFYQIQNHFQRQFDSKRGQMYIQKAWLSEEEKGIARLLDADEDAYLLDFVVDDTVRTLEINTCGLVDGAWQSTSY